MRERARVEESDASVVPVGPVDGEVRRDEPGTLSEALTRLATQARDLLDADYAAVAANTTSGETEWRAIVGNVSDSWRTMPFMPSRLPGGPVHSASPLVIEGFPENPLFPPSEYPVHAAEGMRSAVWIPLRDSAGASIGALVVGWRTPVVVGDQRAQLAKALAEPAGLAIENARLLEDANVARKRAEAGDIAKGQFLSLVSHEL
jgi:GAF domain-containing protein